MKGIDVFVKILGKKKKEGQEFRSLEVRGKLIALKNTSYLGHQRFQKLLVK